LWKIRRFKRVFSKAAAVYLNLQGVEVPIGRGSPRVSFKTSLLVRDLKGQHISCSCHKNAQGSKIQAPLVSWNVEFLITQVK